MLCDWIALVGYTTVVLLLKRVAISPSPSRAFIHVRTGEEEFVGAWHGLTRRLAKPGGFRCQADTYINLKSKPNINLTNTSIHTQYILQSHQFIHSYQSLLNWFGSLI